MNAGSAVLSPRIAPLVAGGTGAADETFGLIEVQGGDGHAAA